MQWEQFLPRSGSPRTSSRDLVAHRNAWQGILGGGVEVKICPSCRVFMIVMLASSKSEKMLARSCSGCAVFAPQTSFQASNKNVLLFLQARKRHMNINVLVRLGLERPRVCPWDDPRFVPGTNRGFLLILHSGNRVCPRDKPGIVWRQKKFMC